VFFFTKAARSALVYDLKSSSARFLRSARSELEALTLAFRGLRLSNWVGEV